MAAVSNVFWLDRPAGKSFSSARSGAHYDVVIVGGGIVGLHTAHLLDAAGLGVAVLEAQQIGYQATGRSTAKVTSQHGLNYSELKTRFGAQEARIYADANESAKDKIAQLCSSLPATAQLEARSAYIYAEDDAQADRLPHEADVAASLDLPAEYLSEHPAPVSCRGLLRYTGQYQFDPCAYLRGLAERLSDRASVCEHSRVTEILGDGPFRLQLEGKVVTASKVVVATQTPVVGDGMFFTRVYPFAHPVAAAPLPAHIDVDGMFISAGSPSHSFRTAQRGGRTYLVAAGAEFKTGDEAAADEAIRDLMAFLLQNFKISEATHLWINEDFRSMDGLPFVGPASSARLGLLVATGFAAWGLTQGLVAAEILASHVLGQAHPAADLFSSTRANPVRSAATFVKENVKAGAELASERLLRSRVVPIADIETGGGGIVHEGGEQLAVRKDADGSVTALSAICTHLGCVVGWNAIDRTWDCSCHGSRFHEDGAVLAGPATQPLEPRSLAQGDDAK